MNQRVLWRPGLTPQDIWGAAPRAPVILFNALSVTRGGGHTVAYNYWQCLSRLRPDWRLLVLLRPTAEELTIQFPPNAFPLVCGHATDNMVSRFFWEKRWLRPIARQFGCDLYFGPNGVYRENLGIPQCLLIQDPTPYVLSQRGVREFVRAALLKRSWRSAVQHGDCVGYTSAYMRRLVLADAGGHQERRHLIAYNGLDDRLLAAADQEPAPLAQREPFVLSVSTFSDHKNFETLVRALARLRRQPPFAQLTLRIMGRDMGRSAYVQQVRREIARLGLEQAVLLEMDRPREELEAAYRSAAVFSLTSLCESFGIPAIEAMAHGAPAVVGDCCAIPEVCGSSAILVPPMDDQAVAAAWARLLTDPAEHLRLQRSAREACRRFTWEATVRRWVGVVDELLREPRPGGAP